MAFTIDLAGGPAGARARFADARTGQILWHQPDCGCDNGRGVADDVYAGSPGAESWSAGVLFGDWREEVVWPTTDNQHLRIHATPDRTDLRITTLMHDTQYREAIAWQNAAYNQPPHPGFFIGDAMPTAPRPAVCTP